MTMTTGGALSQVSVGDAQVEMFSGGSGPPLLFLHGAGGNSGWQGYHEELSKSYTVYVPSQAGFNGTERPDWLYTINDLAHFNLELVQALGLDQYILMGASMGGWVAAEMAAMGALGLMSLVLVDAAGIKPEQGEIAEIFMVSSDTRLKQRFYDPTQVPNYDQLTKDMTPDEQVIDHGNREMASRLCWKPYLHNPSLPHYLRKVSIPTLIVWGRQDAIIPLECGTMYEKSISNSNLKVIDNCGHSPAVERPQEFLDAVNDFLSN